MTEENRRGLVREELSRCEACLDEARALAQAGLAHGAVSRAYYAVFHACRALLAAEGIQVRTHRGVISEVGARFVKSGRLAPELGRIAARMQRDREDADYDIGALFTPDAAAAILADAERFCREARGVLGA